MPKLPVRTPNPYRGIDWKNQIRINGCTHMHCATPAVYDAVLRQDLEFATFSNYYPSMPFYPIRSIHENSTRMGMPNYIQNGRVIHEPLDFHQAFAAWGLDSSGLPDDEGKPLFAPPPESLLEAPNAEHHWFTDCNVYLHITAPGCLLTSGHFDHSAQLGLEKHGIRLGMGLPWREGFAELLKTLIVPDGGGIIINHPQWSHLPHQFLCEMLDFDERVMGLEVLNADAMSSGTGGAEPQWDEVLGTGRQCWGFCTQDHLPDGENPVWRGRSILLPEERSVEGCLRAYRQGRFYGALNGNDLKFESIEFDGRTIRARCDKEAVLLLLCHHGVVKVVWTGRELTYTVPDSERGKHVFLRVTAEELNLHEKLFSQPFMLG